MNGVRHKDTAALVAAAVQRGWTYRKTSGNHLQLRSPHGQIVVTSSTPSDQRAVRNFRSQLRRAGLDI